MGPLFIIFLLFCIVRGQEISTVSSLLKPRNFNHHSFDAEQFLNDLNSVEPTKQGPVLFPNDSPPPPRPPLVVTSRPLLESIARSELGENNTVTSQSQSRLAFVPFLARVKEYRPFIPSSTFNYQFASGPTQVPYAGILKKSRYNSLETDNRYNDYEEQTILPPIYKALSDHAQQKVLRIQNKQNIYQALRPNVEHYNNDIHDDNSETDQNQNYAFSYTVKDHNTGDDFSHSQHSSGSATNGQYRVRLPDGRMQIVSYTADENGYKADVRYDDEHVDITPRKYKQETVNYRPAQAKFTNNYFQAKDYATPVYVTTPSYYKNIEVNDYTDRSNGRPDKDYQYPDSKDYDYSSEYNNNAAPHKSKFNFENYQTASTVKPSYDELKDLFVSKSLYNTQQNYEVTTPLNNEVTTERVVLIGNKTPNLYTDIKHNLNLNAVSYATPKVIVATTPRSYLVSTIASLKNKVHLAAKPILSEDFINRINKYINLK